MLQATTLVHDAYLRLVGSSDPGWESRDHFLAAAAEGGVLPLHQPMERAASPEPGVSTQGPRRGAGPRPESVGKNGMVYLIFLIQYM